MPKVFTSERQKRGKLGEDVAKVFLIKRGYTILEENYTKKYGEMDLIAVKDKHVHFVEVKSIREYVSRETYDPLQNLHAQKLKRLARVIQVYIMSPAFTKATTGSRETNSWQFDVITVKINEATRTARVEHIKDIII